MAAGCGSVCEDMVVVEQGSKSCTLENSRSAIRARVADWLGWELYVGQHLGVVCGVGDGCIACLLIWFASPIRQACKADGILGLNFGGEQL